MAWLIRKSMIPLAALATGWLAHAEYVAERCVDAGGSVQGAICRGVDP